MDRWKADKTGKGVSLDRRGRSSGFVGPPARLDCSSRPGAVSALGLDYLPAASSAAPENSWHQTGPPSNSWANQESPMEESSTVLLDSLKVSGGHVGQRELTFKNQ